MKRLTKQEYYDLLVKSSRDGVFPSRDPDSGRCVYRGPGECRCAVGILLPDELYSTSLEGDIPSRLVERIGSDWIPRGLTHGDLHEVQFCHDDQAFATNERSPWSHDNFLERLNSLHLFSDVTKVYPSS